MEMVEMEYPACGCVNGMEQGGGVRWTTLDQVVVSVLWIGCCIGSIIIVGIRNYPRMFVQAELNCISKEMIDAFPCQYCSE